MTRKTMPSGRAALRDLLIAGVALCGSLTLATPPLTPWAALEKRAEESGIEAVREDYAARIADFEAYLDKSASPANPDQFVQRAMAVSGLFQYGSSWSYSEARAVLRRPGYSQAAHDVCETLISVTHRAGQEFERLLVRVPEMESKVTPEHLAKYGPFIRNLPTLVGNKEELGLRVVVLGGALKDDELVRGAFQAAGGKVRFEGREYASPADFLKNPPDFHRVLDMQPEDASSVGSSGTGAVGQVLAPDLGEEQKDAIRSVVRELYAAMLEGDRQRMASVFHQPSAGREYAARMGGTKILEIDLGAARFDFQGSPKGMMDVTVTEIRMVIERNGERFETRGRKSFRVVFQGGRPRIVGPGRS